MEIELGDVVKDIHSGFVGTAMCKSEFVNGCIQFDVVPKVGKDNKPLESVGIDSQSLVLVKRGPKSLAKAKAKREEAKEAKEAKEDFTGGPISKAHNMRGY